MLQTAIIPSHALTIFRSARTRTILHIAQQLNSRENYFDIISCPDQCPRPQTLARTATASLIGTSPKYGIGPARS